MVLDLMAVVLSSSVGGDLGEMPDGGAIWWLGLPVAWGATPGAGGGPSTEAGAGESTGSSPAKTSLNKPFILSEVLPPVPYKLATRILKGEFVDMAELLCDNLEAQIRAGPVSTGVSRKPYQAAKGDLRFAELGAVLWHLYGGGDQEVPPTYEGTVGLTNPDRA